jgi:hypothetical protein
LLEALDKSHIDPWSLSTGPDSQALKKPESYMIVKNTFCPLMRSAETMKMAFGIVKPRLVRARALIKVQYYGHSGWRYS